MVAAVFHVKEPAPTVSAPVLEVEGLATEFPTRRGRFRAVDGVSFALHPGRTLCLVGESGSGKSVTARSILQIVDPPGRITAGRILLHRHRSAKGGHEEETIGPRRPAPARARDPGRARARRGDHLPGTDELALAGASDR